MNRREFLKTTLSAVLPALISPSVLEKEIERVLDETKEMTDIDFVAYITTQVNLYVNNPRMCAIITNISE